MICDGWKTLKQRLGFLMQQLTKSAPPTHTLPQVLLCGSALWGTVADKPPSYAQSPWYFPLILRKYQEVKGYLFFFITCPRNLPRF